MTVISLAGFICQCGQLGGFNERQEGKPDMANMSPLSEKLYLSMCLCFPIHVFGLIGV